MVLFPNYLLLVAEGFYSVFHLIYHLKHPKLLGMGLRQHQKFDALSLLSHYLSQVIELLRFGYLNPNLGSMAQNYLIESGDKSLNEAHK